MKTFCLVTMLALLLVGPVVAATDENIGIEVTAKGWLAGRRIRGGQSGRCRVSDGSIAARGPAVPRAVPRKLRRNPQSKRQHALLQAALAYYALTNAYC